MKRFTLTLAALAVLAFGFTSAASADDLQKFLKGMKQFKGQSQGQFQQKTFMQQGGGTQKMMIGPGPGPAPAPYSRWRLGIEAVNTWQPGVYINAVDPFGPASRVYLNAFQTVRLETGDMILAADGFQVWNSDSLRDILNANDFGWTVLVIRDVRTHQLREVYAQLEPAAGGGPVVMMQQGGQFGQQQFGGQQQFMQKQAQQGGHSIQDFLKHLKK